MQGFRCSDGSCGGEGEEDEAAGRSGKGLAHGAAESTTLVYYRLE